MSLSSSPELTNLELQFPDLDPGVVPLGTRVLVQIRVPKRITKSGIVIPDEVRDTELDNTTVAKIIGLGPAAFRNRTTLEPWPEGPWVRLGDFVQVPKYSGLRWRVKSPVSDDLVEFVVFEDTNLVAKVTGDPLAFKAFL